MATGHSKGKELQGKWKLHPAYGSGGLWATPTDVAKFMIEVQKATMGKGEILSAKMSNEMLTPQKGNATRGIGFYLNGKEVEVIKSLEDGSYLVQMNDNIQFLACRRDFYIIGKDVSNNAIPHLSYDKLTDSDRRLIGFHLMFHPAADKNQSPLKHPWILSCSDNQ